MAPRERVRGREQTLVVAQIVREQAAGRLVRSGEAVCDRGQRRELGVHQLAEESRRRDRVGRADRYCRRRDPDDRALVGHDVAQPRLPARPPHGGAAPRVMDADLPGHDGGDEVVAVVAGDARALAREQGAGGRERGLRGLVRAVAARDQRGADHLAHLLEHAHPRSRRGVEQVLPGGGALQASQEAGGSERERHRPPAARIVRGGDAPIGEPVERERIVVQRQQTT